MFDDLTFEPEAIDPVHIQAYAEAHALREYMRGRLDGLTDDEAVEHLRETSKIGGGLSMCNWSAILPAGRDGASY